MTLRPRVLVVTLLMVSGLSWPLARETAELFRVDPPALLPPLKAEKIVRSPFPEPTPAPFEESEIRAAVAERTRGLERCFEKQLSQWPTWGGHVELALQLQAGSVVVAEVKEARAKDAEVARCMAGVLRRVSVGTVTAQVVVPIELTTEG